jgi:hypothetical protein
MPRSSIYGLIRGADPATARLAATLEQQCAFMFLHMRQVVEAGGATVEDIIKVTVWMKELQREPVNDGMGEDVSRPGNYRKAPSDQMPWAPPRSWRVHGDVPPVVCGAGRSPSFRQVVRAEPSKEGLTLGERHD